VASTQCGRPPASIERAAIEIVVPARNEARRLPEGLARLCQQAAALPMRAAVVVVDSASTDATAAAVRDFPRGPVPVSLLRCERPGKGIAVRAGLLATRAPFVGFCDAEMATDLAALEVAVGLLAAGHPMVIGSRALDGSVVEARSSAVRRVGAATFRALARQIVPDPPAVARAADRGDGHDPGMSTTDLSRRRIAIVNWRDPWHPQAGGAERYAWEMARALVVRGAKVCFLTARASGQARAEQQAGIQIVRRGGQFTVYPRALGWLLAHRRSFDAVLDCQNGIPFFTPLVLPSKVPVLCVVHHVHSAQFGVHFPWWMASAGRFLEGPAARLVYRRHACVAVSPSTVAAMRRRLRWQGDIYLIPNGVPKAEAEKVRSFLRVPNFPNTSTRNPRNLVWVGRLVAHKRAELLLPLAERLRLRLRNDRLVIDVVGRGPAEGALAAKVAAYSLERTVRLRGFLPEADKQALVAGSLLHLNTSQGEGWGLCVLEAALIDAGAAVRRPATPLERLTGAGQPP
jgi:glycosyltransferase involved in cell wall biosynthesis